MNICPKCRAKLYPLKLKNRVKNRVFFSLCDCGWTDCPSQYLQELKDLKSSMAFESPAQNSFKSLWEKNAKTIQPNPEAPEVPKEPEEPKPEE